MDCIVRTALLIGSDKKLPDFQEKQKVFVRDNVKTMLVTLYDKFKKAEQECRKQPEPAIEGLIIKLYGKKIGHGETLYIVGPMGERPIHVCGFAIAKYRGSGQNHIAEGILEGIQSYVKLSAANESVLFEKYGKDFCAAVASQIHSVGTDQCDEVPYFHHIRMWCERHGKMATKDLGIFEDETIHFALIACGHQKAVKWFVDMDTAKHENRTARNSRGNQSERYANSHRSTVLQT